MKTSKRDITDLLLALGGTNLFKYPIGNKELTEKVKAFEKQGLIKFDTLTTFWTKNK